MNKLIISLGNCLAGHGWRRTSVQEAEVGPALQGVHHRSEVDAGKQNFK
jgi:hypothetical protein